MTNKTSERKILVALPESAANALLLMNASLNAGLADSLRSLIAASTKKPARRRHLPKARMNSIPRTAKYSAEFLGTQLAASTLPEIFAQFVDLTAEVAPESLDKLAAICPEKRRFVARNRAEIHPERPDLGVMQTSSGWWISKNIGQEDLKRALRALAQAAELKFGEDVKFPSNVIPET